MSRLPRLRPDEAVFGELESYGISVAEVPLDRRWDGWARHLFAAEARNLEGVVPRRRWELIAGRVTAHALMRERNWPVVPVIRGSDRSPQWPVGVCGSITHTHSRCAVAIAALDEVFALGLDLEPLTPIEPGLWGMICSPVEISSLYSGHGGLDTGILVRCVFSAKEAFYKAWYPRTHLFLDHHDVQVTLDLDAGSFRVAVVRATVAPQLVGSLAKGVLNIANDHIGTSWSVASVPSG